MKKSNERTEYILITASTPSEWDDCDFAIIKISTEWLLEMKRRLVLLEMFKGDIRFNTITYWEAPEGFYVADENANDILHDLREQFKDWCYVILDELEISKFEEPENQLDCYQVNIAVSGMISFSAIGKYSHEEFSTASFRISDVLNEFQL